MANVEPIRVEGENLLIWRNFLCLDPPRKAGEKTTILLMQKKSPKKTQMVLRSLKGSRSLQIFMRQSNYKEKGGREDVNVV